MRTNPCANEKNILVDVIPNSDGLPEVYSHAKQSDTSTEVFTKIKRNIWNNFTDINKELIKKKILICQKLFDSEVCSLNMFPRNDPRIFTLKDYHSIM